MTADTVKHTPGPWFVEDPMGAEIGLSIVQYGLETYEWEFIAMVCQSDASDERMGRQWFISPEEQMANATLIAAAPDLLEALEGLLADIEEYQRINKLGGEDNHWQVIARAAIAKAMGSQ